MLHTSCVTLNDTGGVIMANNRPNPDDRSDNVEKLQDMVQNTIENIEEAHETLQFADPEERAKIEAKNRRREESIAAMRAEIKDEAAARENGYQ
jgi:small acid-soluble spore protein (thioredoxin-like protein)